MDITKLTDEELLRWTEELARDLRTKTVELVESLVELDQRKLFFSEYRSLFEFCVFKLKMSDGAAYRRIRAARAFQAFPPVKSLLRSGQLSLESLVILHPFLKDEDAESLVARAAGMRVWEVERLVAPRRTEAPRRDVVRFIAAPAPAVPSTIDAGPSTGVSLFDESAIKTAGIEAAPASIAAAPAAPAPPAASAPTDSHGVRIGFTADAAFFKLLREVQAAMRHKYPDGRLEGIFRDALILLLRKKTPYAFRAAKP